MSITKSQTDKINSIFNGNRFIIPTYQRKYSWTNIERIELWQDIEESLNSDMTHFVGTLSFKENKAVGLSTDTTYEIIDGQQRLTTIYILLSVLIDKIQDDEIRNQQLNTFIGSNGNLKLKPLGHDGSFLNALLFDYIDIDPNQLIKRSQRFLYSAKRQFKSLVNPLSQQEIENRIIFILYSLEVLVFNVESQAQAVKMFSIINDRGLPLRTLDKTKSILMLYSTLHLGEKLNTFINDGFEKIFDSYDEIIVSREKLGILSRVDENTIFTHHYYSSRRFFPKTWNNRDGAESVFDNLKLKCEELKDKSDELEEFIRVYINDFELFAIAYSDLIKKSETNLLYEKPFLFLEFSATLYPLIVRLHMQSKLDSLIDLLETIEVRIYKLRGTNPIADIYWLSSDIADGNLTIDNIKKRLISFGEKFMSNYSFGLYLSTNIANNNNIVKYILAEYSMDSFLIDDYKDLQIEHIFSRNPNFDPELYDFGHDYDYEKNTIGNLALIEQNINKSLGNLAPISKVHGYLTSSVTNTRNLAGEIQQGNFNKNNTDVRKKEIVEFCINRFKLN